VPFSRSIALKVVTLGSGYILNPNQAQCFFVSFAGLSKPVSSNDFWGKGIESTLTAKPI
jgi:hypothetical protein